MERRPAVSMWTTRAVWAAATRRAGNARPSRWRTGPRATTRIRARSATLVSTARAPVQRRAARCPPTRARLRRAHKRPASASSSPSRTGRRARMAIYARPMTSAQAACVPVRRWTALRRPAPAGPAPAIRRMAHAPWRTWLAAQRATTGTRVPTARPAPAVCAAAVCSWRTRARATTTTCARRARPVSAERARPRSRTVHLGSTRRARRACATPKRASARSSLSPTRPAPVGGRPTATRATTATRAPRGTPARATSAWVRPSIARSTPTRATKGSALQKRGPAARALLSRAKRATMGSSAR